MRYPLFCSFLYSCIILLSYQTETQAQTKIFDESLYAGAVEYRLIGPFRGGRSCTVTGVPSNDKLYYFGSVGGGVWRTTDAGQTYENISDGYFGGSIGAVAVSASDPNVIYAGEGEKTVRGNVSSGFGLWKSTDAGASWKHIGLRESRHIGRIRIHPTNPDIVYVAAMGDLWKSSDMRGVYKTTNGGESWDRILFANQDAGAVDLILEPGNPDVIYASTWNVRRTPYNFSSGGSGSGLWKSTDGGVTWDNLTEKVNLPKAPVGIIGVTVSPVNPKRVYALIEAKDGGVFRSDDAGQSWEKMSADRALRSRAWYYTRIYADTQDEDKVYVMNVSYGVSDDGGKTWDLKRAPHGDHHDLWIDPDNNQRMVIADDGGAQVSTDGGDNWTTYHNQPTAQFYRIYTDNHFPYRIYAAQQDNSAIRISHRGDGGRITEDDWESTAGGESASHAVSASDPDIVYGGTYKGYMYRYDHKTKQRRYINVWPLNPAGSGVEVMKYRFNWNFPVAVSQHEPEKLYVFSNRVHVSTNEGQSWETVSPDLTRNEAETLLSSGGPITQDNTGVEFYGNLFTQSESPHEKGVWWVGSDDGRLHLTQDGCESWQDITPKIAPKRIMWNSIDPHPSIKGGAYIAGTMYKSGDFQPYLYKTTDYGKTWQKITSGIDDQHFTRVVRADPDREGLLYAGTEYGMYISFDDGKSWKSFKLNLPIVPITDLQVKENNLIVGTQGRSIWIIDDLSPLHQLDDNTAKQEATLYQPKDAYRMKRGRSSSSSKTSGENHPNGTIVSYYLKEADPNMTLAILEADGDLIKTFEKKDLNTTSGSHRFIWDMRYPDATSFDGIVLYSSNTKGPLAPPGAYQVRIKTGDHTLTQPFKILKDPRSSSSDEDLTQQFEFLIDIRDKLSEANQAIVDIRDVKDDFIYVKEKLKKHGAQDLIDDIDKIEAEMIVIENNIHETRNEARQDPLNFGIKLNNRLAFLATTEGSGDFPPTDQAVAYKEEVSAQIDQEVSDLHVIFNDKLQRVNQLIAERQIPMISFGSQRLNDKP